MSYASADYNTRAGLSAFSVNQTARVGLTSARFECNGIDLDFEGGVDSTDGGGNLCSQRGAGWSCSSVTNCRASSSALTPLTVY